MRRVIWTQAGLLAATAILVMAAFVGALPGTHVSTARSDSGQTALKPSVTYTWNNIAFTEAGLPANQIWSVFLVEWGYSLGNNTPAGITFTVNATSNGTAGNMYGNYTYSVNPVAGYDYSAVGTALLCGPGYCNVTTASAAVVVTFTLSPQYSVQFNESGLAAGTEWSATFNGVTLSAAAPATIIFGSPNGTYPFSVGLGGTQTGANQTTPSSGTITVAGPTYQNITYWPFTQVTITTAFTSPFSTDGLPYFTLPYNITWTVSLGGGATIDANFSQQLNVTWLISGCGPFTFPCLPLFQSAVNPSWETAATATSGNFYFPLALANLTASTYLGFDLPQGQWQISVWDNYNDGIGNSTSLEVDAAAFIAATPPSGSISQPLANSNITAGHAVISGEFSGYFVTSANVTVYSSSGATVLTVPVYAPGTQQHAFAVSWPAVTPGVYQIDLILTAAWHQVFYFNTSVNIVPGVPLTYHNTTANGLIPGLSNGGSAALLVVLGAIIGMIVMAIVGRGMMGGGPKPAPAQAWNPATTTPSSGTTGGTSGGMSGGGTGGSSDSGSGMGGSNPPS